MKKLLRFYKRWRGRYRRLHRLIYMSPAEARFVELMGGKVWTFDKLRSTKTGFPFTLVLSLGKQLKAEKFKREVRYGSHWVDFANDLHRIIEIDGKLFHMDVVAQMDREIEIKLAQQDVRFLRIPAFRIYNSPDRVQAYVLKFIAEGRT